MPAVTQGTWNALYYYTLRWVGVSMDPEDVVQETLMAAIQGKYRGKSAYWTWLLGIAKHKAIDHVRKISKREKFCIDNDVERYDGQPTPLDRLLCKTKRLSLDKMLSGLPEAQERVIRLKADGMASTEIARRLSVSVSNVDVMAHRARGKLHEHRAEYGL